MLCGRLEIIPNISLADPDGGGRGGGGQGFNPAPLKDNVKGFNPKYKMIS